MPNTPKKNDVKIPSAKAASELDTVDSKDSTPRSHSSMSPAQSNLAAAPAKADSQLSSLSKSNSSQSLSPDDQRDIFLARAYDGNGFPPERLEELKKKNQDDQGGPSVIGKTPSRPVTPSPRSRFNLFSQVNDVADAYMASRATSPNKPR